MLAADAIEAPDWVAIPLAAIMLTIVGVLYWRGERYRTRTQEAIRACARHNNHILCAAHMNKLRGMRFDSRDRDSILYIEVDQAGINRSGWLTPKPPTKELPLGDFDVEWE